MSSQAQALANRRNAQRSTGPKTEEGKEVVSQNAVKHGLSARRDVIRGEDAEEFQRHQREMLEDLAPAGAMEALLAGRIVSLSWRLIRAQRMQNMAFEALFAKGISDFREEADSWLDDDDDAEPEQGRDALATDLALGRAITRDFADSKVLERMLAYEGKIEGSLYRATAELEKLRRMRRSDDRSEIHPSNPLPLGAQDRALQNEANSQAEGQRHRGTEAQRELHAQGVQNKANVGEQRDEGTEVQRHRGDADEATLQDKARLQARQPDAAAEGSTPGSLPAGGEGAILQNKANLEGQWPDAAMGETTMGPVPAGT